MSGKDSLGDRMKWYESRYTEHKLMPMIPVLARCDGRSFSSFTRGLEKPYDERLSRLMIETTKYLVSETNARCGYTQSDEISLTWLTEESESQGLYGGKLLKLTSVIGAMATAFFNKNLPNYIPEKAHLLPVFDNRVWEVPVMYEAVNCFIWREMDATRNSVTSAARAHFSHKQIQNKNSSELQEMLFQEKQINWNNYPTFFKRGTYVRRKTVERSMEPQELASLPPKHKAHTDPNFKIVRSSVVAEELPPLTKITNRDDVIFFGAEPQLAGDDRCSTVPT